MMHLIQKIIINLNIKVNQALNCCYEYVLIPTKEIKYNLDLNCCYIHNDFV